MSVRGVLPLLSLFGRRPRARLEPRSAVPGKDLSAFPVCGSVRPSASQRALSG